MAKYEDILREWFYLLLPKGESFEAFEGAEGAADRHKTRTIFDQMSMELPRTFANILHIEPFEYDPDVLEEIDTRLTPATVQHWMKNSDANDSNNFFKLTVSELAVYFGTLLLRSYEGRWHYARFPNFFQSSVIVEDVAVHVFDTLIKRCSDDYRHETLVGKWETFARLASAGHARSQTIS